MKILELFKKIFSGFLELWNFYGGIILSTLLAWVFDFNRTHMDTTTSYIILSITIISVLTIIKKENKKKIVQDSNFKDNEPKKNKDKKEKKKKEKLNIIEKTTLLNPQFKALENALNPLETAKDLSETIIETTTLLERIGKFMKEKITNFFKRLWGNKLTITNITINLLAVAVADYLIFSDYLLRFEFIAQNELAFKIGVPVATVIYLVLDIFTTVSKYGWESLNELNEKAKQKALQKTSKLSKEQKEVVKKQVETVKNTLNGLEDELNHFNEIINNYQVLTSLSHIMPVSPENTALYNQVMAKKPSLEVQISELKINLTQLQQALK